MKDHRTVRKPKQHLYTFAALLTEVKVTTGMFVNGRFISCGSPNFRMATLWIRTWNVPIAIQHHILQVDRR